MPAARRRDGTCMFAIVSQSVPAVQSAPTSPLYQLAVLMGRNMRAWKRHPIMLIGEAVQYVFLAFFVGGMYFDVSDSAERGVFDRAAAGFFIIVTVAFTCASLLQAQFRTADRLAVHHLA